MVEWGDRWGSWTLEDGKGDPSEASWLDAIVDVVLQAELNGVDRRCFFDGSLRQEAVSTLWGDSRRTYLGRLGVR